MGENVDAAKRIEGPGECSAYGIAIADVSLQGKRVPPVRCDFGHDRISALATRLVHDGNVGTAPGEFERDGATHASASSRNERGATREIAHALPKIRV
jgi:hypothetical protein